MQLDRRALLGSVVVVGLALVVVVGGAPTLATTVNDAPTPEDADDDSDPSPGDVSLSEQDAIDVATGEVDGTVREVELEREDGTPVYEITVEASNGSVTELAIHANDGTIVEIESETDREDDDAEREDEREEDGDENEDEREEDDDENEDEREEDDDENEEAGEDEREANEDENEDEDGTEDDDGEDEAPVASSNVTLSEQDAIDVATGEVDGTVREVELEREDGTPVYEITVERETGAVSELSVHANDGTVLDVETEDEEDEDEEAGETED